MTVYFLITDRNCVYLDGGQGVRTGKSWEREKYNKNIVYEKIYFQLKKKERKGEGRKKGIKEKRKEKKEGNGLKSKQKPYQNSVSSPP